MSDEATVFVVEASTTGAGQLANESLRRRGLHVTLLSRRPEAYAAGILAPVHEVVRCNTNDYASLLAAAKDGGRRARAVFTTADMYVPQSAFLAQAFGVPSMPLEAAETARNKARTRARLADRAPEISVPSAVAADLRRALAIADELGYPLVAKPQLENDGVAVRRIDGPEALTEYFASQRPGLFNSAQQEQPAEVVLERYARGVEYSIETVQAAGGELQLIGVTQKLLAGQERGCFVEVGHAFPYLGPEVEPLTRAVRRALAVLGVNCGCVHTEARIDGERVVIIEVNPRLAGGKIGSHLVPLATGLSAVDAAIDCALGAPVSWRARETRGAAIRFLTADRAGRFAGVAEMDAIRMAPSVEAFALLTPIGADVRPPQSNGDNVAELICVGADAVSAAETAEALASRARVLVN